ncbi:hypothetical protein [Nocardia caishijiensis]|uniref:HEPN AbiU2-like domain-containing protein n=1 Tax=Nocardia caishijiensis TaxID=184756 RepID=A0ABQ6YE80_9NOCA|nr:hypothetical protein [Nocardia caishijiensis]KAF0835714.1 hypothetical protein FNL39_11916 [Nocardia caishijiensis]
MRFDDIKHVWPAEHHDLSAPPTHHSHLSDIGWQRRMGLYGRIQGFRRAAEILHHAMLTDQSVRDLDTVVFPYATCWRHHIELQLKSILVQLRVMCDLPAKAAHHHKIDQLWAETQKIIAKEFPDEKVDLDNVSRVIGQLSKLDPDGQEFRYASRRDGSDTLPDLDRINLLAFHEAMLGVAQYLDATDTAAGETISMKREIDEYYAEAFDDWDSY